MILTNSEPTVIGAHKTLEGFWLVENFFWSTTTATTDFFVMMAAAAAAGGVPVAAVIALHISTQVMMFYRRGQPRPADMRGLGWLNTLFAFGEGTLLSWTCCLDARELAV